MKGIDNFRQHILIIVVFQLWNIPYLRVIRRISLISAYSLMHFAYKRIIELWPCTALISKHSRACSQFQYLRVSRNHYAYVWFSRFSRSMCRFLAGRYAVMRMITQTSIWPHPFLEHVNTTRAHVYLDTVISIQAQLAIRRTLLLSAGFLPVGM